MISKEEKKQQGKKNKASGRRFEIKVRDELEMKGWVVFKNNNNVEMVETVNGQTILFKPSKPKWNPFRKSIMMASQGFPDYICVRNKGEWQVQFVECKSGKYLSADEKEKSEWIVNKLQIPMFVAFRGKKRGEIVYDMIPTKELFS